MFLTSRQFLTMLCNYIILGLFVMFISLGMTNVFTNSNRLEQQQRLDYYSRYVSAGLVNTLQQLIR